MSISNPQLEIGGSSRDTTDDLVLEIEGRSDASSLTTKRSLIGKIMADKILNKNTVKGMIRKGWGEPQGVSIVDFGPNMFLFTFVDEEKPKIGHEQKSCNEAKTVCRYDTTKSKYGAFLGTSQARSLIEEFEGSKQNHVHGGGKQKIRIEERENYFDFSGINCNVTKTNNQGATSQASRPPNPTILLQNQIWRQLAMPNSSQIQRMAATQSQVLMGGHNHNVGNDSDELKENVGINCGNMPLDLNNVGFSNLMQTRPNCEGSSSSNKSAKKSPIEKLGLSQHLSPIQLGDRRPEVNFRLPTDYNPKPNYFGIITNSPENITANTIISNKSSFKWSVCKKNQKQRTNPYIAKLPLEDSSPELVVESQGLSAVEAKNLSQSFEKALVLKRPRRVDNFFHTGDVDNEGEHKYSNGMEMAKKAGLIKPLPSP
ncbi:hypothetical protein Pint_00548 [Pistacia integerrima]|uniref:Uncharacterized protein n=1 Tax=Pistacia integerrima TaxID=434235 RepID=A0ACC0ZIP7_9ROSI|nr:hypothetical protein Pint_00548 [Pistacia integerrima]